MDRREFLRGSVFAATAGLALDACAPDASVLIPILVPEEPFVPGEESFGASVCYECAGACGLSVRKIDGRLVKVEGLLHHPVSRGGVCARGQALPQAMYHPDRIPGPLVREGDRGAGSWKSVSWDEALDRVAGDLREIGARSSSSSSSSGTGTGTGAHADDAIVGFLTGEQNGHRAALVRRFLSAFGRGRHYVHEPFTTGPIRRAHRLATGYESVFGCALEEAAFVVSFGAELLESHLSPVGFARGLAEMRRGRPGLRGKLVMVGPRLSLTAAKADEWLPARPGTETEIVLAVASVLLKENRQHPDVESASNGFASFRELVLSRAAPADVERRTGVSAKRIERLAHELAEHRPAVALAGGPAARQRQGMPLALAVSHLNALLGGYRADGVLRVGIEAPGFAEWSSASASASPAPESSPLAKALAGGGPLPPALFVCDTNPLHSLPTSFSLEERFRAAALVVSFSSYLDETTRWADVVLPESMSFERFEDAVPDFAPVTMASLSGPLLTRPIHDTRSMPDALLALARKVGLADAFPWESYESALREAWKPLPLSWDDAIASGGFFSSERAGRQGRFATADGRYHFLTEPLEAALTPSPDSGSSEGRLALHLYPTTAFGDGRSAHLPFLQDLADPITGVRWATVVEIASSLAERLELAQGDLVRVQVGDRSLTAPVHPSPGIHPDVIAVGLGQGHTGYGRYARDRGRNPYALLDAAFDEDGFLMTATGVALQKVRAT
jgi:anaerobic selenocysteine-containing dehydrogenase